MTDQQELANYRSRAARLERDVIDEIARLDEEHQLYVFRPETRCRVCNSDASEVVNRMLSHAMTYRDIMRVLDPTVNQQLPEGERITYNSIAHHAKNHFPIHQTAKAVYRRIVEKRAVEFNQDFVAGTGTALTPLAFYDIVMQKAFQTLVDENMVVDIDQGMKAADRLQQVMNKDEEKDADLAEAMIQLRSITEAVKAEVPKELWPRILARMEGRAMPIDAELEDEQP